MAFLAKTISRRNKYMYKKTKNKNTKTNRLPIFRTALDRLQSTRCDWNFDEWFFSCFLFAVIPFGINVSWLVGSWHLPNWKVEKCPDIPSAVLCNISAAGGGGGGAASAKMFRCQVSMNHSHGHHHPSIHYFTIISNGVNIVAQPHQSNSPTIGQYRIGEHFHSIIPRMLETAWVFNPHPFNMLPLADCRRICGGACWGELPLGCCGSDVARLRFHLTLPAAGLTELINRRASFSRCVH